MKYIHAILRPPLRYISILIVKYLQKRYKSITIMNRRNQSNQVLAKLILIKHILYYFKCQFDAWGYFHPSCVWTDQDEVFLRRLFPEIGFEELDIVVWYSPEAVTYYMNKIYELTDGHPPNYEKEIKKKIKN